VVALGEYLMSLSFGGLLQVAAVVGVDGRGHSEDVCVANPGWEAIP
jgi:hypothetical protein